MSFRSIPPVDEAQREKVRHGLLDASVLVEAGAGTGKTSLMIDRLVNLTDTFDLTELVAMTFTEKAAGELHDRLRREIERRITESDPDHPDSKLLQTINAIDRAHISTIHAFATALVRMRPIEAGVDPDFQHLDPDEERELLEEALASELNHPDPQRDRLLSRFVALGGNFGHLRTLLHDLYKERDLLLQSRPASSTEASGRADIPVGQNGRPDTPVGRSQVAERKHRLDRFINEVTELAEKARRECVDPSDGGLIQIERISSIMPESSEYGDEEIFRWLIELAHINTKSGNQDNWEGPDCCREFKARLRFLRDAAVETLERLRGEIIGQIALWLKDVVDRVNHTKLLQGRLGFKDQLIYARGLLDTPETLRLFKDSFKRVLIDEFQDTDPLQVEIAFLLAGTTPPTTDFDAIELELGKLCIVGDPKQSIYRFRRADPRIYRRAADKLVRRGERVPITQNFRSAPGIIKFVNEFFTPLWQGEIAGGIDYQPLTPEPGRIDLKPVPPVTIIRPGGGWDGAEANADRVRSKEAESVARIIITAVGGEEWRKGGPDGSSGRVSYGDIAVLFPVTTNIEIYAEALGMMGIPYHLEGGRGFYHRQIVTDLYNCLAAMDNPADRLAVFGALRSSFFGISDQEIVNWVDASDGKADYRHPTPELPELLADALNVLRELHALRRSLTPDRLIETLLELTGVYPAIMTERIGRTDAALIAGGIESARRFGANHGPGLRAFRRTLLKRIENGRDEEAIAGEAPPDHVRLMTIHGAKGLEFPVVILANLNVGWRGTPNVIPDRIDRRLEFSVGSRKTAFRSSGYLEEEGKEKDAQIAERLRLLYVAMTRARDHLVLPLFYGKKPAGYAEWLNQFVERRGNFADQSNRLFRHITLEDLCRCSGKVDGAETESIDVSGVLEELESWQQDRLTRLETARCVLPKVVLPSRHIAEQRDGFLHNVHPMISVTDESLGRALHRYMALCQAATEIDPALAGCVARESGIDSVDLIPLIRICLEGDMWRDALSARRFWREVPVTVGRDEGLLRGVVDLVWEDSDGRLHVGDWKTGAFDPERHQTQIREYVSAVGHATGREVASGRLFLAGEGRSIFVE